MPETPFDTVESAHEYLSLLTQALDEATASIDEECAVAVGLGAARREQALRLVAFKLAKLGAHLAEGRRILNDLRTLRRLLLAERNEAARPARRPAGRGRS